MRLGDFRVLSFDCYGTLIDWESGIHAALQPLLARVNPALSRDAALEAFAREESAQERETPGMLYPEVLAQVYRRLAAGWGVSDAGAEEFGRSVKDWPAFPDSADALRALKDRYRLVILSNVDRESFEHSRRRLQVSFDEVCTAQDVGSYKPDPANFAYLLAKVEGMGFGKADLLHVAQSLFHDHAPAKACGLATAWIDRRQSQGWGATVPPPADVSYDFRFAGLAEMVEAARRGP
ncbi:MAG: haloacid dehalogenase type II [Acidisphaera sp.]|nr:haloacid dehalogenase type II [Acidisphaera sp.]